MRSKNNQQSQKIIFTVSIFVIFLFVSFFAVSQLIEARRIGNEKNGLIKSLEAKLAIFESSPQVDEESIRDLVSAVPTQDNSLVVYSQIKRLSVEKAVSVRSLNSAVVDNPIIEGAKNTLVNFVIEGQSENVLSFLTEVKNMAPRILLQDIRLNKDQESKLRGQVSIVSPWRLLPQNIPSLVSSPVELNDLEMAEIEKLKSLGEPILSSTVDPSASASIQTGRQNPFSQIQTVEDDDREEVVEETLN